jgi:uncharacterized protein with FMN-binding domain
MKKILLSFGVIAIFTGYAVYQHLNQTPATAPITDNTPAPAQTQTGQTPVSQNPPSNNPVATPKPAPAPAPAQTPPPTPAPSGKFKNGTYTGSSADALYGTVQVAAVISGGKLTDVQILQSPSDRGHSAQLSQMALPQLKSEAIAAQSSVVQIISGATQTSQAFEQSLQSALSQAM